MYEERDGTHARDLFAPRPQDRDDGAGATYTARCIRSAGSFETWDVNGIAVSWDSRWADHPAICSRCDPMLTCQHVQAVQAARAAREG